MSDQLQDIFDIDQIILPLSPVTPGAQAFFDSFDLSAMATSNLVGAEDSYYQEKPVQAMLTNDTLVEDPFMAFLENTKHEEEGTFVGTPDGAELFGPEGDSTDIQTTPDFTFDVFIPDTETAMARCTTIDDSQIDPELLGSPTSITPSSLFFYSPLKAQYAIGNTEIYEPITLGHPRSDLKSDMLHQISAFSQSPATEEATHPTKAYSEAPEQLFVPIDFGDFFQSTAIPPRIRVDGTYAVENNRTGFVHYYTTYTPLPIWYAPGFDSSGVNYNSLGFLNKEIKLTASTLINFIRYHPLGPKLILRIEKHPYEVKGRFASARSTKGKQTYTCCRDASCVLGGALRVGELRVAIDEITGRFKDSDEQDNDPYFSCGFLHLQCFETLINIAPLLHMGLLVPDLRKGFAKEPPCGKGIINNNKMALSAKETIAFYEWVESSTPTQDQVLGRESLTSKLWLANCKKSRTKRIHRAPPGVTQADIDAQNQTRTLWGGRRAVGRSVEEMNRLEREGRCNELIAPRNGASGKLGMGPTGATALRFAKRKIEGETKKGRNKRACLSTPPSSPNPNLRKATLCSPPQKGRHNAPGNITAYSTPKRILSPVYMFSPSLSQWNLLDDFATLPLGPKSSQPSTPTANRRSPRFHRKINYNDFDSDDNKYGTKGNDKENGDWTGLDLFEEILC